MGVWSVELPLSVRRVQHIALYAPLLVLHLFPVCGQSHVQWLWILTLHFSVLPALEKGVAEPIMILVQGKQH